MRTSPAPRPPAMPVALVLATLALLLTVAPVAATDPVTPSEPTPIPSTTAGDPAAPLVPAPTPTPYTAFADPALAATVASVPAGLPAAITFQGRGYGHGVGMSQHGARGRAMAGQDTPEILGHYFPGTTPGLVDPATVVRVQVLGAYPATATRPLRIYGRGGAWAIEGLAAVFPPDAQLRVWRVAITTPTGTRTSAWRTDVVDAAGTLVHSGTMTASFRVSPVDSTTTFQLWSKPSSYDRYRGALLVVARAKPDVVNELPLEDYLRGVVPVEMPASWPAAALRAQAIAARSYAVRRIRPAAAFDLYDDTRSQAYRGVLAERPTTDEAVALTAGMVLQYGSSIADTYFHSSSGGATEANELVWVSSTGRVTNAPVPYLRGGPDRAPDGTAYDATAGHYAWQTGTYSAEQLSGILARDPRTAVGSLLAIDLSRRAPSGRVIAITISGTAGTRTVSADVFRVVFNRHKPSGHPVLKSTMFAIGTWPTP